MCGGGGLKVSLIRYTLSDLVDFVQTGASGGRVNISGFVSWKLILCAKCATRMHFSPFHIMNTCSKDISPTYFSGLLSICQNKVAQRVQRCLAYRLVLNGRTSRGGLSDDANGVGGCLGAWLISNSMPPPLKDHFIYAIPTRQDVCTGERTRQMHDGPKTVSRL